MRRVPGQLTTVLLWLVQFFTASAAACDGVPMPTALPALFILAFDSTKGFPGEGPGMDEDDWDFDAAAALQLDVARQEIDGHVGSAFDLADDALQSEGSREGASEGRDPVLREEAGTRASPSRGSCAALCPLPPALPGARVQQLLGPMPPFIAAKQFDGARPGMVFQLGVSGLGYYPDLQAPRDPPCHEMRPKFPIVLDDLVLAGDAINRDDLASPTPRAPRMRRPARRCRAVVAGDPHALAWPGDVPLDDTQYKHWGLWALVTANVTAWSSADALLRRAGADAILLQEHHIVGQDACSRLAQASTYPRWRLSLQAALATDRGGSSAGVAIAVARHTGLSHSIDLPQRATMSHRLQIRHWSGLCKGGVHLVSVYLYDGEGLSRRNLDLLQELSFVIRQLRGLWICGGDFNLSEAELRASNWLSLVDGVTVAADGPSCGDRTIDFFVVPKVLRSHVVAVQRLESAGTAPHTPVRILIRGDCRRAVVRALRAPRQIGASLPSGCLSEEASITETIRRDAPEEQLHAMYEAAERVALEVMSVPPCQAHAYSGRAFGSSFVWRPYVAPRAEAAGRLSPLAIAWRTGASALRRLQARFHGHSRQHGATLTIMHLHRVSQGLGDDNRRAPWFDWLHLVEVTLCTDFDRTRLGQLGALAAANAKTIGREDAAAASAAFRSWLHDGPAAGLGRQHRFTRIATGWVPSSLLPTSHCTDSPDVADVAGGCVHLAADNGEEVVEALDGDNPAISSSSALPGSSAAQVLPVPAAVPAGIHLRPASLQDEAEAQALHWGAEWLCDAESYRLPWPADLGSALPPLDAVKLDGALRSFSGGVGLGWDKMHPRSWLRLGPSMLLSMLHLFLLVEECGRWPGAIGDVLIVLLAKPAGGFRPIGLFPSIVRVWMRIRLADAVVWQSLYERPWLHASAGKGADIAAWKQAARSEQAASRDWHYAAVLLDLVKAFERVPHATLVLQAHALGYNLRLLRVSLAAYRLPRAVGLEGVYSQRVVAARGITAGAGHAVVELRLLLSDLWDRVHRMHRSVPLTVYVDDTGLEAMGTERHVLRVLPRAVRAVEEGLGALGMELSASKCVASGSSLRVAAHVARECSAFIQLRVVRHAISLGVGLSGGRAPATHALRQRLKTFQMRLPRFAAIRQLAVSTARLLRTGAVSGLTYGAASTGVAPTLLHAQRVATAKAMGDRTSGGDLDLTLAVADGARGGMADPAFQAHLQPIVTWAHAVWSSWIPRADLVDLAAWAVRTLASARRPWAAVCGPATATAASLARLGWRFRDGLTLVTHSGEEVLLTQDSPARVAAIVREAVIQWRWRRVEIRHPQLRPPRDAMSLGPCWRPLARLLDPSVRIPGWTADLRGALRSAVTNRQWSQSRKHSAGLVAEPYCCLCSRGTAASDYSAGGTSSRAPAVGSLIHRSVQCPCHQILRQTSAPREVSDCSADLSKVGDRWLWFTRALQPTRAYEVPAPSPEATFQWVVRPPDGTISTAWTVYTDGSLLDGPTPLLGRCGWAFVALDAAGVVRASAHGVPPGWITTIFGAETWAILQAVAHASGPSALRVDCKAAVDVLFSGRACAVSVKRVTARAWAAIFDAIATVPLGSLSWVPAHTVAADVGVRRIGNGQFLTARDRAGNDLADQLAKEAVAAHRVPLRVREAIAAQEKSVSDMAWWVARVTLAANAWGADKIRDSESALRPRRQHGLQARARRQPEEIPVSLGGHDIAVADRHLARAWQCRICRRSAARRSTLAFSRCPGSAVRRWAQQAALVAGPGQGSGRGHTLLLTGSVVWCFRCGATACVRARLLTQPCRGRLLGGLAQAHQRLLLGLHPATRAPLCQLTVPEPGCQLPTGFAAAVRRAEASATAAAGTCARLRPRDVAPPPAPAWRTAMLARIAARRVSAAGS